MRRSDKEPTSKQESQPLPVQESQPLPVEEPFAYDELTIEIKDLISSILPHKELLNLRQTSKMNREIIDTLIFSDVYFKQLLEQMSHKSLVHFMKVYQQINSTLLINNIIKPQNLDAILDKSTPQELFKLLQTFHSPEGAPFINAIMKELEKDPKRILSLLKTLDKDQIAEFTQMYPNLFAEKVKAQKATMDEFLIFMITADNFYNIKLEDIEALYKKSKNDPVSKADEQFISSFRIMYLAIQLLDDPHLDGNQKFSRLTMLFVQYLEKFPHLFCNFKNLDCSDINIFSLNLSNSNFSGVDFTKTNFSDSNLQNSLFIGAIFNKCLLMTSNFSDSNLTGANFDKAVLDKVNFSYANLSHANLAGVNLSRNIKLTGANLSFANLSNANLAGIDFGSVNWHQANLTGAIIIDPKNFLTESLLDKQLKEIFRQLDNHPNADIVLKALAEQITSHIMKTEKINKSHAQDLQEVAVKYDLFRPNLQHQKDSPHFYTPSNLQTTFIPESSVTSNSQPKNDKEPEKSVEIQPKR